MKTVGNTALLAMLALTGCPSASGDAILIDFDRDAPPPDMLQHNTVARIVPFDGKRAMQVDFDVVAWPNVFFTPPADTWDWSKYAGLEVELYNPTELTVPVCMRVDNDGADGANHCNTSSTAVPPLERATLQCRFNTGAHHELWGMRGLPVLGPVPSGSIIDTARIVAFQVFLPRPSHPHTLVLKQARLFGRGGTLSKLVSMPFVDRFGQYIHDDWPGKLKSEVEFAQRRRAEEAAWNAASQLPGRDEYGGWTDGPQLDATGWFRVEQVKDMWWLVTPGGHLFFSNGVDCVGTWQRTFVSGRDNWFAWLPDRHEAPYAELFSEQSDAHSMADPINGNGTTFGFYAANLIRKYGTGWKEAWRDSAYRRLRHWGFNTIANWSQADVLEHSPMPFVGNVGCWGDVREIELSLIHISEPTRPY